ncbi:MAG: class I SAM-dependent methyltransferase, partial [Deltaproteobacteria bacterium]|nr:class I SAM-dependent methyltransferase [Deltaproteobacteria bacterium]
MRSASSETWPQTLRRIRRRFKSRAMRWWWGDRLDGRFLLARWVRTQSRGRVLDLGCGPGIILAEVPSGLAKTGLDIDRQALKTAAGFNPEALLVAGDWQALPFDQGSFETLILSGVLCSSLPQAVKEGILSEASRVLSPGGRLLSFDTNRLHWATGRFDPNQMDFGQLQALLAAWGFFVEEAVGWNVVPSFIFFAPPALKRRLAAKGHRYKYFFLPS